jgi:hypothetical protein
MPHGIAIFSDQIYQPATFVYRPYSSTGTSRRNRPQLKTDPLQIIDYV